MGLYQYRLHNLIVASSLCFPELTPVPGHEADLYIRETPVPDHLPAYEIIRQGVLWDGELRYELTQNSMLIGIPGIARLLLVDAQLLLVEREPGIDDATLRLYLLGTGLGFLCIQRGVFPFHASAVQTPFGTVLFMGASGLGKSTIAAKFVQEGHTLLSDDVCLVTCQDNNLLHAYPSSHRIKLWDDSLAALNLDDHQASPIMPDWDKKQLHLSGQFANEPSIVAAIYCLEISDESGLSLDVLKSNEKLVALVSNTYRAEAVELFGLQKKHFLYCSAVAQQVPVKRLQRPAKPFSVDALYQLVMTDLATHSSHFATQHLPSTSELWPC